MLGCLLGVTAVVEVLILVNMDDIEDACFFLYDVNIW